MLGHVDMSARNTSVVKAASPKPKAYCDVGMTMMMTMMMKMIVMIVMMVIVVAVTMACHRLFTTHASRGIRIQQV